jgi:putative aldouronate transport system substrate-binding protein
MLALALVVSACSGGGNNAGSNSNTGTGGSTTGQNSGGGNTSSNTDQDSAEKPLEPVTYSMNSIVEYMHWDNPVAKEITRRTGVTIEWDNVPTNEAEKINLWLVGGDYPDLLWLNDKFLGDYVKANAVHDLTDLIEEHGPNIKAAFNNDLSFLKQEDGRIWALRAPPASEIDDQGKRGWIHIQIAVLEEAGWPEIKSLDDVYNVVKSYAEKYPEINGGKTIGFSNYGNDNQFYNNFEIASSGRYMGGDLAFGPVVVAEDNTVRFKWFDDGATDVLRFLNRANADGLFDQEWLMQTPDQFNAKCTQGRVLAAFGAAPCSADLEKLGMPERQYISFDLVRPGATRKANINLKGSDRWVAISKNVDDPVRAIKFFDEMYKLENQILLGWGIEGEHYNVVDGVRTIADGVYDKITSSPDGYEQLGLSYGRYFMLPWQGGAKLSDGDFARFNISPSWIAAGLNQTIKDALAKYGASTFSDLVVDEIPVEVPYGSMQVPDDAVTWRTEAIAEWNKAATAVILEPDPSKIDQIWADFEQTLKNKGLEERNAQLTNLYKEFLANQ